MNRSKIVVLLIVSLVCCSNDAFAQSELLKGYQNGIYVSGGFEQLNDDESTLFTETVSLILRGRVEFGVKYIQVYEGKSFNETFGSVQIFKPSESFHIGAGVSMSVVKGGRIGYLGGSFNWGSEAPGKDQFIARLSFGATRTKFGIGGNSIDVNDVERIDVRNALTLSGSLIASSRIVKGLQLTFRPQYTWQKHIGSIVGLQIGVLRLDPDLGGER